MPVRNSGSRAAWSTKVKVLGAREYQKRQNLVLVCCALEKEPEEFPVLGLHPDMEIYIIEVY